MAIDCSGAPSAQNAALDAVRKRGAVAFVGESRKTEINPSDQIIRKLLTVVGGWYFPLGEWDEISRFVVDNQLPVEDLVTHRFALADAAEAFRAFDDRETEKAVFVWDVTRSPTRTTRRSSCSATPQKSSRTTTTRLEDSLAQLAGAGLHRGQPLVLGAARWPPT